MTRPDEVPEDFEPASTDEPQELPPPSDSAEVADSTAEVSFLQESAEPSADVAETRAEMREINLTAEYLHEADAGAGDD